MFVDKYAFKFNYNVSEHYYFSRIVYGFNCVKGDVHILGAPVYKRDKLWGVIFCPTKS